MLPEVGNVGAANESAANVTQQRPPSETDVLEKAKARKLAEANQAKDSYNAAKSATARSNNAKDQVDLHFSMTQEEKVAFSRYLATREEDGSSVFLTDEDRDLMQKAAERIVNAIDETIAKNHESRQRVEKAVSEWYSQLAKGESRDSFGFIQLLRDAAMGKFDE